MTDIVAAESEHHNFGARVDYFPPIDLRRGLMVAAQRIAAACNLHELWSPMTRAKRRIHPFHQETAWPMRNATRSVSHEFDTFRQSGDDLMRPLRRSARVSDASNIIENVREACWLKVHYLWWTR